MRIAPILIAAAGLLAANPAVPPVGNEVPRVLSLQLADAIQPITAQFVVDSLH